MITAMVLTDNSADYLGYCLDSIFDIVDEIIVVDNHSVDGTKEIFKKYNANKLRVFQQEPSWNYSDLRNFAIEKATNDYILWLDSDEILANQNGEPLTRTELEHIVKMGATSYDIFTIHFMYNYFTIDGRNNGQHFSRDRIFNKKKIKGFSNVMHENIIFKDKAFKRIIENPIIFHFGHCRGIVNLMNKYKFSWNLAKKNDFPFANELRMAKTPEQYCANHPIIKGTIPLIRYNGHLPKVMGLW